MASVLLPRRWISGRARHPEGCRPPRWRRRTPSMLARCWRSTAAGKMASPRRRSPCWAAAGPAKARPQSALHTRSRTGRSCTCRSIRCSAGNWWNGIGILGWISRRCWVVAMRSIRSQTISVSSPSVWPRASRPTWISTVRAAGPLTARTARASGGPHSRRCASEPPRRRGSSPQATGFSAVCRRTWRAASPARDRGRFHTTRHLDF